MRPLLLTCTVFLVACLDNSVEPVRCPIGEEGLVPRRTVGSLTLRWGNVERIPLWVDPALSEYEPDLHAALDAWSGFSCTTIGFETAAAPDDLHGLEVRHTPLSGTSAGRVDLEFNEANGFVQRAVIHVSPEHAAFDRRAFLYWVGSALALGSAPAGADTAMAFDRVVDGSITAPTSADEQAICSLYRTDC